MLNKRDVLNAVRKLQMDDSVESNHDNFVYKAYCKVLNTIENMREEVVTEDDGK